MSFKIIEDKEFKGVDFSETTLEKGEYDTCRFVNCNFANTQLSGIAFEECVFENSDLSMIKTVNTSFNNVKFNGCKMLGVHFDECNKFVFTVSFEGCILNLSSFYQMNIRNMKFNNCSLIETDFTQTNLTSAIFNNCNMAGTIFSGTILEKADLLTSINYTIDPESNKIRKARFSTAGVLGLLSKYDIRIENA